MHAAVELRVPTVAICRGLQVVNVALGGTLLQHITGRADLLPHSAPGFPKPPAGTIGPLNEITLAPDSRLARVFGATVVHGACSHHQAIDRLGKDLHAVGTSADGMVEAFEHDDAPLVAVQWHPEDTAAHDPQQQRIFDVLVERALTESAPRTRIAPRHRARAAAAISSRRSAFEACTPRSEVGLEECRRVYRRYVGRGDAAVDDERLAVIQADSSDARKSAAGVSRLPEAAHRDVDQAALAAGIVGEELGQQRRHDRSGTESVGPDALTGVDDGDLAGHGQHRALGRRVRDLGRGGTHVGDERGHVDDGPATALEQGRDAVPAAEGTPSR